jgi:hypothetical protein
MAGGLLLLVAPGESRKLGRCIEDKGEVGVGSVTRLEHFAGLKRGQRLNRKVIMPQRIVLFHTPNSSTSMRVYLTWKLKGLQDVVELADVPGSGTCNWSKNEEYLQINPEGRVPALHVDGKLLTQSWAIMLYLEDTFPDSLPLMPVGISKVWECAQVLRIAMIFACDTHPLQNLGMIGDAVSNG